MKQAKPKKHKKAAAREPQVQPPIRVDMRRDLWKIAARPQPRTGR